MHGPNASTQALKPMTSLRAFFALLLTTILFASPAEACLWEGAHETIFFKDIPAAAEADVIAKVVITQGWQGQEQGEPAATLARITQPIKGGVQQGEIIELRYKVSDCGPWPTTGEEGLIVTKQTTGNKQHKVLAPYTHHMHEDSEHHALLPPAE